MFEDGRNRIVDLPHQEPRLACVRVVAIRAGASFPFTDAREREQRTVKNANDGTDRHLFRRNHKIVSALYTSAASDYAGILQRQQYGLKEFGRSVRLGRNNLDQDRPFSILPRQEVQRPERVLALSRQPSHSLEVYLVDRLYILSEILSSPDFILQKGFRDSSGRIDPEARQK